MEAQPVDAAERVSTNNAGIDVAMLTPWRARCGISDYSRLLVAELDRLPDIASVRIVETPDSTPRLGMSGALRQYLPTERLYYELGHELNDGASMAHIQHQYFFFGGVAPHKNHAHALLDAVKVPLVMTVHEVVAPTGSAVARAAIALTNRRNFRHPALRALLVHTATDRDLLVEMGTPPDRIHVVTHGIPTPAPMPDAETAKAMLGLTGKRVVTLFGFLSSKKGHGIALDALPYLPEDILILFAGDQHPDDHTDYVAALRARLEAINSATERARITGYLPEAELPALMAATDVAIAPYTQTSGSGSVANQLAYGRAIVASDIAPHQAFLAAQPDSLLLFPAGDPQALANAITSVLDDPARRDLLQAGARAYAQAHSYAAMAQTTVEIYKSVMAK